MPERRPRILVTRPEPGAARTARALGAAGFEPVVVPFTEIVPLAVAQPVAADAARCDAVAVTSANAVSHLSDDLFDALRDKPVFAVGDATMRAARERGFANVISADGAAEDLAELIDRGIDRTARIGYLCGRVRTGELEAALQRAGRSTFLIETYDAQKVSRLTDKMDTILRSSPPDGLLLHSGVAAAILSADIVPELASQAVENIPVFAISNRVAKHLPATLASRVTIADMPRDDALIAAVKAHFFSNPSKAGA